MRKKSAIVEDFKRLGLASEQERAYFRSLASQESISDDQMSGSEEWSEYAHHTGLPIDAELESDPK